MKIKLSIGKNAARIIISTLVILSVIGIAIGANPNPNTVPGHDILQIRNNNIGFSLTSDHIRLTAYNTTGQSGYLEVYAESTSDGLRVTSPATSQYANIGTATDATSNYTGIAHNTSKQTPQLKVRPNKVEVTSGNELCLGGSTGSNCISSWGSISGAGGMLTAIHNCSIILNSPQYADHPICSSDLGIHVGSDTYVDISGGGEVTSVYGICPVGYKAIGGGARCSSNSNDLWINTPHVNGISTGESWIETNVTDKDRLWQVSCGSANSSVREITFICAPKT